MKDETAPVFDGEIDETQFEGLKVGDTITIPTITATDDVDGDVEVFVSFGNMMIQNPSQMGEEITLDFAGSYVIKYVAQDAAENVAEKEIMFEVAEEDTVAKALNNAVANGYLVKSGTLKSTIPNGVDEEGNQKYYVIDDVTYELAPKYAHIVKSYEENWIMAYDGGILWLVDEGSGVNKSNYEPVAGMENGFAFETVFDYENTYYGVEEFVSAIYNLSTPKDEKVEDGVYSFAIEYVNASEVKYEVAVSFTVDGNKVMNSVVIDIEKFYAGEEGYSETADSVKTYTITQSTEGDVTPEYKPEELLVSSYTIKDADENEVTKDTVLDLVAGAGVTLTMADVPEGCEAAYDTFTATVVNNDSGEVVEDAVAVYVSTYSNEIYVTPNEVGEYKITITSAFVTKKFTVSVAMPETTELKVIVNGWQEVTETKIFLEGDWATLDYEIQANEYADADVYVDVEGAGDSADVYADEIYFETDCVGTYTITFTSAVNEEVSTTLTIVVENPPSLFEVLGGTEGMKTHQNVGKSKDNDLMIMYADGMAIVTYTGVQFDYSAWEEIDIKWAYIYLIDVNVDTKEITLNNPVYEGGELTEEMLAQEIENMGYTGYELNANVLNSITVNADYTLSAVYAERNQMGKLEPWVELEENPYEDVAGEYRFIEYDEEGSMTGRWVLGLSDNGTGALYNQIWNSDRFMWMTGEQIVEFNYTVAEDGSIEITEITFGEVAGFDLETVNDTIVYDEEMSFGGEYGYQCPGISFTFNGETTAFEKN